MIKGMLALVMLLAVGVAGAEELPGLKPELYYTDTDGTQIKFWDEPECPEGWGHIVVKLPLSHDYKMVDIRCGIIVEPAAVVCGEEVR